MNRFGTLLSASVLLLLASVAGGPAVWALDGTVLGMEGNAFERGDIIKVDMPSGQRTTLATGNSAGPCFSPDGRKVAYWKDSGVWIMDNNGANKQKIASTSGWNQQCMSWTSTGYIYWTEKKYDWYRVSVSTGKVSIARTFSGVKVNRGKVSLDGTRGSGSSYPDGGGLKVYSYDLTTGQTRNLGTGCQGTVSPDGTLITHLLNGHQRVKLHRFSDGSVYKELTVSGMEFNAQRFSHSSNDYVVWSRENITPPVGYVSYIHTNTHYKVADNIGPYDFWLGALPSPGGGTPPPPPPPPPPPSPDQDPVVTFTTPSDGATLSGTVSVNARVNDPDSGPGDGDGIDNVVFELLSGATVVASLQENFLTYDWSLDTTAFSDGSYSLGATATATAVAGGSSSTTSISVTINNTGAPPPPPPPSTLGDANEDGSVTMADLNLLVDWNLGRTAPPAPGSSAFTSADVNGDGTVSMADVNRMVDFLLGRIPSL